MGGTADLREQVAAAVNAKNLGPDGWAAGVVGAMGAASVVRGFSARHGRVVAQVTEVGTPVVSDSGRLASLLKRAKYAGDRSAVWPAVTLFARWMTTDRRARVRVKLRPGERMLLAFAGIVVTEWLHDKCQGCRGVGLVRVGEAAKNAKTVQCGECRGTGKPGERHVERAALLGVPMDVYRKHWQDRIKEAEGWLMSIEATGIYRLRRELGVGIISPVAPALPSNPHQAR